jgi:HAD superfamily phosphatase (TIGR01668 family)
MDIEKLAALGFKTLLVDLDNTLASYDQLIPEKRTYELVDAIHKKGIEIILLTNNTKRRIAPYAGKLHVSYLSSTHKPLTSRLKKLLREHSLDPAKTLLIGDQVINDMKMGAKAGVKTCLSEPLTAKDHISAKLIRPLDKRLRNRYRSQGRLGPSLDRETN